MAIKLEKSILSINQVIANKIETSMIEGDCIVPDVKPDIVEIINTSGVVNIYKREVMDGKIRIDGCINIYIMYLGDDGKVRTTRSLNHVLDFSQIVNAENATSDMILMGETVLKNINCKIINERKINIQANVDFEVKLFANSNIEYVNGVNINDIQKLESTMTVNSLIGNGETKVNAKDTIQLDKTDNLAEILKVNSSISNRDIKISYNKVLSKADVKIKILYSTEDGKIMSITKSLPVVGFIDIKDINENNVVNSEMLINNMIIKPNSTQDHSIYVEVEVGMQVIAYSNKEIKVIQDIYSPSKNLGFEQQAVATIQNKALYHEVFNLSDKQLINIGDEKVYDADVNVITNQIKVFNDETDLSGTIECIFTHSINNMTGISTKKIEIPFTYKMPCKGIIQDANAQINYDIVTQDFNIMPGGEVDIKLSIEFYILSSNSTNIKLISNVIESENNIKDNYNMVIYFTKSNDNLWEIAKRFKSTQELIISQNELKNNSITPGMQLFISRYMGTNG